MSNALPEDTTVARDYQAPSVVEQLSTPSCLAKQHEHTHIETILHLVADCLEAQLTFWARLDAGKVRITHRYDPTGLLQRESSRLEEYCQTQLSEGKELLLVEDGQADSPSVGLQHPQVSALGAYNGYLQRDSTGSPCGVLGTAYADARPWCKGKETFLRLCSRLILQSIESFALHNDDMWESEPSHLHRVGIALLNQDGEYRQVNEVFCSILGYTADELRLLRADQVTYPDDVAADQQLVADLIEGRCSYYTREKRYLHKSGAVIWASIRCVLVDRAKDAPVDISEHIIDITDLKQEMVARDVLGSIMATSMDAIFTKTPTGIITSWNSGAEQLYGYTAAEMIGQSVARIVSEERKGELAEILHRVAQGEAIKTLDTRRTSKDGNDIPVSVNITPIHDSTGRVISASVVVRSHQLEDKWAEDRFRSLLGAAPIAIVACNVAGRVILLNAQAEKMFGYAATELIGQSVDQLLDEPLRESHAQHRLNYMTNPHARPMGSWLELHALTKDGRRVPVEISLNVVEGQEGVLIMAAIHDISARKQAEQTARCYAEALEQTNTELARVNRLKSEFLATMSHEIRTPMNGIIGMTRLLLDTHLTDEQREYAELVGASGDALLTIINDILDFSKIEAGRLELEEIEYNIWHVVEEVGELLAAQAHVKGLELSILIDSGVPHFGRGDPGRVRQILLNLVGNAVKFTAQGEVVLFVDVPERLAERSPDPTAPLTMRITVRDTGIGIDPRVQENLFQPFRQADGSTTRQYGGSGLGLAISKRLSELMGGEIGFESTPGQGSTFWFTVPVGQATTSIDKDSPLPINLQGHRVLSVDDNGTNQRILQHYLAGLQMHSAIVGDAASALAALYAAHDQGSPFDVAILDMDLPEMDGMELARTIRQDARVAGTKLVLLASVLPRERGMVRDSVELDAILTKPVRQGHLAACLSSVLGATETLSFPPFSATERGESTAALPLEQSVSHGRILVAEDNIVSQRVARGLLQKRGYEIDLVSTGRQAVDALQDAAYDLVLMDCHMPEMDGYSATSEIRRLERTGAMAAAWTPIIALTAEALQGEDEHCLNAGMDAYLTKPINPDHLEAMLTRWLPAKAAALPQAHGAPERECDDVLDEQTLNNLRELQVEGQPDILSEFCTLYLRDTTSRIANLRAAIAAGDTALVQREAHSLLGSSRNMGMKEMVKLIDTIESSARTGDVDVLKALSPTVERAFQRAQLALQSVARSQPAA